MRHGLTALLAALVLVLGTWAGAYLWGDAPAEHEPLTRTPPTPPPLGAKAGPQVVRQWLREMTPVQKTALLKELLASLREDVIQRHRQAAQRRFGQADSDKDGKLSFEEAWQAGLFRPFPGAREGRAEIGAARGPRPRLRARARRGPGGPEVAPTPQPQGPGSQFPANQFEQELLDSWELLEELNVLARDAGEE